jgi:hypothetical protein
MVERLAVDNDNQLKEIRKTAFPKQPGAVRGAAWIISYLFHPVFLPVYVVGFLVFVHPYMFAGFSERNKSIVVIQAFVALTLFPLVTVFLCKGLKLINSVQLKTQRDRIIPYVACEVWYFWLWYVWRNLPDYPIQVVQFALAVFVAGSIGLLANIYMKVSMHAIAVGVAICFFIILALTEPIPFGLYVTAALLMGGLVCTARFIVSDHTTKEVYVGLFIGMISQLIGYWLG